MLKRIFYLLDKSGDEHKDQRGLLLTFLSIALTTLLVSTPLALEELGTFVYFGFLERLGFTVERVTVDGIAPGVDRCDMRLETLR